MTKITFDIEFLEALRKKPEYGKMGSPLWTDPHIAGQMLKCHLNPDMDAASRKRETIEQITGWLYSRLGLQSGQRLLDLGCGPGLYAESFSRMGLRVTGVDFSSGSIQYARESAEANGLDIEYICGNYLNTPLGSGYDAAVIIYYDLGVLFPWDRDLFLARVYNALAPGGWFAFDVLGPGAKGNGHTQEWWASSQSGFYRPGPHVVLTDYFHYPQEQAWLDQYVIGDEGETKVIRNWEHYYTPAGITAVLEKAGFGVQEVRSDLAGAQLSESTKTLAVLAQKK